jgi:hypothetical protein
MVSSVLTLVGTLNDLGAAPAASAPQSVQGRWHFVVGGDPEFTYSILFSRSAAQDETRLLLRTFASRLEFVSRQNPAGSDSLESVRDVATLELLSRRLLLSGYESVAGCERVSPPDACLLFTGMNGKAAASMAEFSGKDSAAVRGRMAGLASERLKKVLYEAAPCFGRVLEFSSYQDDFLGLIWPERFRRQAGGSLGGGTRRPGCAFDAAFGFPCSDEERRREKIRFGRD